jgi:hypothetical protein
MPWVCDICGNEVPGAPPAAASPRCYKTTACKKKIMNGCTWIAPAVQAVQPTTDADGAATLGYTLRVNSHGKKFPNGHATNVVYENLSHSRAISSDGSTHSGNREGWKGFTIDSGGYHYAGSFQANLAVWPHRPNETFQGPFPQG